MKLKRSFDRTHFGPEVISEALQLFGEVLPEDDRPINLRRLGIARGTESWSFDSLEEFIAEYRQPHHESSVYVWGKSASRYLAISESPYGTDVTTLQDDRVSVLRILSIFEEQAERYRMPLPSPLPPPAPVPPRIFIGHGGSAQWRDLKDHLHESHGYAVEAYEVGARAGHVIRDILEDMLDASSFALLVHTGEDETVGGELRARQNVVHETGLFQGRLGFGRALVLLEEGAADYSNLQGVHQIRYGQGNIKETFGEVLATLRREFEPEARVSKTATPGPHST